MSLKILLLQNIFFDFLIFVFLIAPDYSISHYCVNSEFCKRMVTIERQCWINVQYSRRECLEVVEIPRQVDDKEEFRNKGAVNLPEDWLHF